MKRLPIPAQGLWTALVLLLALLIWDASGLDLAIMQLWGHAQGFPLKNNYWLSHVLHTRGQQASLWLFLALWILAWRPLGPWRTIERSQRIAAMLAVTACALAIAVLKHFSQTSCPWDLQAFGGPAQYISHWALGMADGGGGKCFPSGHASSAFSFLAISLPFLRSPRAHQQRFGRQLLMLVLVVGLVFSLTQTVRGAHYPSHSLWTAWICWVLGQLVYRLTCPRPRY